MSCLFAFLAAVSLGEALVASPANRPDQVAARDLYSDTWVAADGLGRVLPDRTVVGGPRPGKAVGMFYFLTFDPTVEGPYDNTKILHVHPEAIDDVKNPAWGPLNAAHYWGEPLFGYYSSDDESVLRKHAAMLIDAGIDMVVFDNSNAVTYDRARNALLRVWEEIRREGGKTPQIAFLCPFGNTGGIGSSTLSRLYDDVYASERYADLLYRWRGKPLILADPSYVDTAALSSLSRRHPARLSPHATLAQSFTVDRPFVAAGGSFPTWGTKTSGATLSLYEGGLEGRLVARRVLCEVADNATSFVEAVRPLPAGRYTLQISDAVGTIGWWSDSGVPSSKGAAFEGGDRVGGGRSLYVRYVDSAEPRALLEPSERPSKEALERRAAVLRNFFTFRTPIAPYNVQSPPPDA